MNHQEAADTLEGVLNSVEPALSHDEVRDICAVIEFLREDDDE